jgi:WD40 repeat protein
MLFRTYSILILLIFLIYPLLVFGQGRYETYTDAVLSIAFSPNEKLLAVGRGMLSTKSNYGEVELWDTSTKQLVHIFKGYTRPVTALAFSLDSKTLFTTSNERVDLSPKGSLDKSKPIGVIKIWDVESRDLKGSFIAYNGRINSLVISPNGELIATTGYEETSMSIEGEIKIWNAQTGELKNRIKGRRYGYAPIAFSPDSRRLAVAISNSDFVKWTNAVEIIDLQTGKVINKYKAINSSREVLIETIPNDRTRYNIKIPAKGRLHSIEFSPDGKSILTGSGTFYLKDLSRRREASIEVGGIALLDLETDKLTSDLRRHQSSIVEVAFSPTGREFITGSRNGAVEVWATEDTRFKGTLVKYQSPVGDISISARGALLASGSYEGELILIDIRPPIPTSTSLSAPNKIQKKAASNLTFSANRIQSLAYSKDGKLLASGSTDNSLSLWSIQTGVEVWKRQVHEGDVNAIAISPDGSRIVTAGSDGILAISNLKDGELIYSFKEGDISINSLAFSIDGTQIAFGGDDKTIKILDLKDRTIKGLLKGHDGAVTSLAYHPDGKSLISSSSDTKVRLWDIETMAVKRTFAGNTVSVLSISISSDGRYVAAGGEDGRLWVWYISTGQLKWSSDKHESQINAVAFMKDRELIATGSEDKQARIWEVETGKNIRTLKEHEGTVAALSFSPDGKYLACGSGNNMIVIWNVERGKVERILRETIQDSTEDDF